MEELPVLLNEREIKKLEYLVRSRVTHIERRRDGGKAKGKENHAEQLETLYSIQDKLERARLRV